MRSLLAADVANVPCDKVASSVRTVKRGEQGQGKDAYLLCTDNFQFALALNEFMQV